MYICNILYNYIYTYTMKCYSAIKEWNHAIYSNVYGPRDYHAKVKWERQILYNNAYMWNLKKMIQMNLFTKQK